MTESEDDRMPWKDSDNLVKNRDGEWVPSIPFPLFGLRKKCRFPGCHKHYFTEAGYRGHYALAHILKLPDKQGKGKLCFSCLSVHPGGSSGTEGTAIQPCQSWQPPHSDGERFPMP